MACCEWVAAWVWPPRYCATRLRLWDGGLGCYGGISMRCRPNPLFVEHKWSFAQMPRASSTGWKDCSVRKRGQCQ